MKEITLHGRWVIKASTEQVFKIMTDFENFPVYFPNVAESLHITKREDAYLEMEAVVKSFGKLFPVQMKAHIVPGKGFITDNHSPQFGTSGHEEFIISEHPEGAVIDYTYQVSIHKLWLRIVAAPLIKWYSMKFWEKAVIDKLRAMLEK